MRKPILIIKTGNTIDSLLAMGEDFEDWFVSASGFATDNFLVKSLHLNEPLDPLENISAIIVTGSPAYVTDEESWNFIGAEYLRDAHQKGIPILGVCYGHQLIAWAFEGEVDFHPSGREIGTVAIELTAAAKNDPLFSELPRQFTAQLSHQQSVTVLPLDAVRLASNEFESNQAFRMGSSTWGIQFHPEFNSRIVREYIMARREAIESEGLDVEQLLGEVQESPFSQNVLQSFCQLALGES